MGALRPDDPQTVGFIKAVWVRSGQVWPEDEDRQRAIVDVALELLLEERRAAEEAFKHSPVVEALLDLWCQQHPLSQRRTIALLLEVVMARPADREPEHGYPPSRLAGPTPTWSWSVGDQEPHRRLGHLPTMDEQEAWMDFDEQVLSLDDDPES